MRVSQEFQAFTRIRLDRVWVLFCDVIIRILLVFFSLHSLFQQGRDQVSLTSWKQAIPFCSRKQLYETNLTQYQSRQILIHHNDKLQIRPYSNTISSLAIFYRKINIPLLDKANKTNKMSKKQRKSCTQFSSLKQTIQSPQKSSRTTQKEINHNPEKSSAASIPKINMEMMFEANKNYLMQKIAISQIPRPSKYYHKIPSKTPGTTYNNQFHKSNTNHMNQIKLQRKDNLTNQKPPVTNYQSLYGHNFGHLEQRTKSLASTPMKDNYSTLKPKEKTNYQPAEGPTFLDTSYSVNFIKHNNPIPTQSAKMKEVNLMGGGKFKGESHYNNAFKSHQQKRQKPIQHSNNKIFMTIVAPKQTTYGKEFSSAKNSKTIQPKSVPKTADEPKSSRKRVSSQMMETAKELEKKKFKSEYERSFQTLQAPSSSRSKKASLMSLQEMKNLILNVL